MIIYTIMAKFKVKLNDLEIRALAMTAANVGVKGPKAKSLTGLITYETLERLWSRMRNMYRPDLKKYCLRLNTTETQVVMEVLVPVMRSGDDPYMVALGNRIEDSLFNQVNTEINIYNAMR